MDYSDYKGKFLEVKLEKLEADALIGFPIEIKRDDQALSAPSDSTPSVRIKTESLCDEKSKDSKTINNHGDINYLTISNGQLKSLKGEIIEIDSKTINNHGDINYLTISNEQLKSLKGEIIEMDDEKKVEENNSSLHRSPYRRPTYLCEFCGYFEKHSTVRFYRHYSIHFDTAEDQYFECYHCGLKTRRKEILRDHIKNVHSSSKRYLCDKCSFTTNYLRVLDKHQIKHTVFKKDKVHYKCSLCNYETKKKSAYEIHKRVHVDASHSDMFKCHLCKYESKRESNLKHHMLRHKKITETKSYDCELCAYKTKYPHLLRGHIKTNHQKFPKALVKHCNKCDFQTNNKYSLETHVKKEHKKPHSPKIYKCDKCPYKTEVKSTLKRVHALIHQDITERIFYGCYNCGVKYNTKKNLRVHIILKHLMKKQAQV